MIGTEDLQWWHSQAAQLTWKSARTYARRAPHAYVVARQGEISEADFERGSAVIRMFGQPGFYYQYPNIYLTSPDGQFKWWIMDDVGGNDLINRAAGDLWYGPQVAPNTSSSEFTSWDAVALTWDRIRDTSADGKSVAASSSVSGKNNRRSWTWTAVRGRCWTSVVARTRSARPAQLHRGRPESGNGEPTVPEASVVCAVGAAQVRGLRRP